MLKLDENPPIVLPGIETLADLTGRWWVGHTKSRFEKAFAWDLLQRGIGYFLPLIERVRMSGGRKRHVMAPLFPGYVFFCGSRENRYEAMTTNRLCQTLTVHDQETLVRELVLIEKALAGKAELDPYPFAAIGQRCRITAGPFRGLEGVVVQRNCLARLVLEVSMLGQGAALEIDAGLLEAVA
ncbi:MAG: transcription termination/antitermination NusG family protein [Phycisphaerae bacterium]